MDYKKTLEKLGGKKNLIIFLIIGIILIIAGSTFFPAKSEPKQQKQENKMEKVDEKALEEILSNIEGAGKVKVFITYQDSGTKEVATDVKRNTAQGQKEETDITVKTMTQQGGGQEPYVISEKSPEIKGILVTATGATSDEVKIRIYESVKAAVGVPLHKINVDLGNK